MDDPIWQTSQATYTIDDLIETATDPGNNVSEFAYDSRRMLHTSEDAASRVVTRSYDELGRLLTVTDPGSVVQATYSYSDNGRVASVEDANSNVTEYEHDGFDRLKKKIFPDLTFEQKIFDEFGRTVGVLTRAGDEIAFDFDDLNRLIERAPDNMPTVSYEYDLAGRVLKTGTPVVMGNPASGVFENFFDSAGRLVKEKYPDSKQVQYQLDELGNVIRLTYPDSYYIERVFDELNRLTDIKLNGAMGSALVFDYDPLSRRTKLTYENGGETDYGFELDNDLSSLIQTFTGSSVAFTYGFNNVHELSSQAVDDSQYLWHPTVGDTKTYGTANNLNQYPSVDGDDYTFNVNGCLVDNDVWEFGYDTENQLVSADDGVTSASYIYDPMGRQTQKNVDGTKTRYIHSGIRIIAEYDGTDTFVKRYVHGTSLDEVLLEIDDADDVTYLHHDRIGSVIATTNDTGAVVDTFAYSPWGECDDMTGTTFGFQGQRFDHETGLYFMKARYYDPKIGRFLQPDPIGYGDGLNIYQFGYNNPNIFRDPLGLGADGSGGISDTAYGVFQGIVDLFGKLLGDTGYNDLTLNDGSEIRLLGVDPLSGLITVDDTLAGSITVTTTSQQVNPFVYKRESNGLAIIIESKDPHSTFLTPQGTLTNQGSGQMFWWYQRTYHLEALHFYDVRGETFFIGADGIGYTVGKTAKFDIGDWQKLMQLLLVAAPQALKGYLDDDILNEEDNARKMEKLRLLFNR